MLPARDLPGTRYRLIIGGAPGRIRTCAHGSGGRQLVTGQRRADSLACGVGPLDTLPGRVIGAKPPAVCRWIFTLLGAGPGDILDDLFPGSGAVSRAWAAYTGHEPSPEARADASSPAAGDPSYPSPEALHDAYAQLPLDFAR